MPGIIAILCAGYWCAPLAAQEILLDLPPYRPVAPAHHAPSDAGEGRPHSWSDDASWSDRPSLYFTPMGESQFFSDEWTWRLLPDGLMYRSYIAGDKEPRISAAFLREYGKETYFDAVLGGRAGLVRFGSRDAIGPEGWQLDVEGGAFLRLQPQDQRDVMAADFRVGFPLTWRSGPFQSKFGYYHISSHLGDEFLLKTPGFQRRNYSRDTIVWGMGYFPVEELRVYGEIGYAFYTTGGARPWEVQAGVEWSDPAGTSWRGKPFAATNVHLRQELDWSGSWNSVVGWEWRNRNTDHAFRVGLQYFTGANNQYSFLYDNQQLVGILVRYDY